MKNPFWSVIGVQPQQDYTLLITFTEGEQRIYNALPLLKKPLYAELKNKAFFLTARAAHGTVVWSSEIDIAPEHLYAHSVPVQGDEYHA